MYADDTHLTYADSDVNAIQSCLNEDLQNISEWLIANKLTLNMTKTEFMLIGSRQKLRTLTASLILTINGTHINEVATSKSLGIFIDSNLSWQGGTTSISWLKRFPLALQQSNGLDNLFSHQRCILFTRL